MNYEPSHRKPPSQERWPNATPANAWPAYGYDEAAQPAAAMAGRAGPGYGSAPPWESYTWGNQGSYGQTSYGQASYGQASDTQAYPVADDWVTDGFDGMADGYRAPVGYREQVEYQGYPEQAAYQDYPEQAEYPGYQEQAGYPEAGYGALSVLVAPDMIGDWWQPGTRVAPAREASRDSVVIGAVTGFLSAAVAVGVATLAAGLIRSQASPVSVFGAMVLDRLPAGPRAALLSHLGTHGGAVLLLGLAGAIGVLAGIAARRRPGIWVAGLAVAGLLGAFVAVTRSGGRTIDVLPPAVGVAAGIMALLWLAHAAAPITAPVSTAPRRPR